MANIGAFPVDPTTPVGLFRVEVGDDTGVQIDPPSGVTAEYEFFSDAAIQALIDAYPDSIETAQAKALASMGRRLIIQAQDIQVDDIRIKTVERAKLFIEHSNQLLALSATGDAASGFSVVPLHSTQSAGYGRPQGTPYPEVG